MQIRLKKSVFLEHFFIIGFLTSFLYMFYLGIKGVYALPVYLIITTLFVMYYVIFNYNNFKHAIINLSKTIYFKSIITLCFCIIIGLIISFAQNRFYTGDVIRGMVGGFIFAVLIPYLFAFIGSFKLFNLQKLAKITFFIFLFIYIIGVLDFIGGLTHFKLLESFVRIFTNRFVLVEDFAGYERPTVFSSGLPRIASIAQEPSVHAYMLLITLPIIFKLCFTKALIFKNKLTDFLLKQITFILMLFNFIGTQAPVHFILAAIIGIIAFNKYLLKKSLFFKIIYINIFLVIILFVYIKGFNINLSADMWNRIYIGMDLLKNDPWGILYTDQSLGTRVISVINYFIIFLKNPLFGIGYGNLNTEILYQLQYSPIPLTREMSLRMGAEGSSALPSVILARFLAETGIIGTILLYGIFIFTVIRVNKLLKDRDFLEKDFLIGIKYFIIVLVATSWYSSFLHLPMIWAFLGIVHGAIIYNREV